MQIQTPNTPSRFTASKFALVRPILGFLSAICYLLTSNICLAADVSVTAAVEPSEMRPAGYGSYVITIEGGQPDDAPRPQLPAGIEFASVTPSYSNQTSIINGVVNRSATLTWQITASATGELVIPAQEIHVSGKPYRTNEVRITIKDNPASPAAQFDPLLTIETPKREIYLGEVIPITVNLYLHRRTMLSRIGLIEIPKDNYAIQRFPLQAEESNVSIGGAPYRALAFRSTLSALKAGQYKLGPASCELIIEVPMDGARQMNPFFSQSVSRRIKPQGNEIEMTILPLPETGKPASFSGVVGDFKMSATAEPREATVGDPISIEITVTGSGNFDAIPALSLASSDDWKTYPARRINIERADPNGERQQPHATFNQVVIPKKALTEIPAMEFSYFNPEKKTYSTARTEPIPLRLKPGSTSSTPPAPTGIKVNGVNQLPPDADKVPPVQPRITDIVTVIPAQAVWLTPRTALFSDRTFLIRNACALGALLLLIGGKVCALCLRNRAAAPDAPQRRMWKQLRRAHMSRGEFYRTAARYIQQQTHGASAIPATWQAVLDRNDSLNYSPASVETGKPMPSKERREVLHSIQG